MLIDDSATELVAVSDKASDFILSETDEADSGRSTPDDMALETTHLDAVVYSDQPISISNLGRSQAWSNPCVMTVVSNCKATPGISLRKRKAKQEYPEDPKVEEIPDSTDPDCSSSRRSNQNPTPFTPRGIEGKRRKMKGPAPMD